MGSERISMNFDERVLYHQAHPLKLTTDVCTAIIALWLLAAHRLLFAVVVMLVPRILISVALVFFADLAAIRGSSLGRYLHRYMTRAAEAVRLMGMGIMSVGAWQHRWWPIGLGAASIVAAWTWGLRPGIGNAARTTRRTR
jgi:hypothetical protein